MKTFLWALASIFFELTAAGVERAAAGVEAAQSIDGEACEGPVGARGLERELELARAKDVYLRLDAGCREIAVLAGGVELASVPFAAVEFLGYRPAHGAPDGLAPLDLPAVRTVTDDLSAASRRVVAPPYLRPYSERDEPAPSVGPAAPGGIAEAPEPSSYRVRLDGGWVLELVPRPAAHGLSTRIAQALQDGWLRLAGERPERPSRIVLVLGPEEARSLHHLFRAGMRILVLPGQPD